MYRRCCPVDDENKPLPVNEDGRHTPTMYMIGRVFGKDSDYLDAHSNQGNNARNSIVSNDSVHPYAVTVRTSRNKNDKNTVLVYPPRASGLSNRQTSFSTDIKSASSTKNNRETIPMTVRNIKGKNLVWVHPSPQRQASMRSTSSATRSRANTASDIQPELLPTASASVDKKAT